MTKTKKVPILGIVSPNIIAIFRIGFYENRVTRETETTHTFYLSLIELTCENQADIQINENA